MRPDLGRLDAIAEILQIGPLVTQTLRASVAADAVIYCPQYAELRDENFGAAAVTGGGQGRLTRKVPTST
jgi:hypothetical protein